MVCLLRSALASDITIHGGSVRLAGDLKASTVTVKSGGTLTGEGAITGNGLVDGGTLAPRGSGAAAGLLDFSGTIEFSPAGNLDVSVPDNTSIDWLRAGSNVSGTCTVIVDNPLSAVPVNVVLINSLGAGPDYSAFTLASGTETNWFLKVSGTDLLVTERWGDTDADSLPDWWEVEYYGDRTNAASSAQDDADTMSNFEEYIAGTDPTNPASLFCFTEISTVDSNKIVLKWQSATDRLYTIEVSTNLVEGFTNMVVDIPDTAPLNTYTNELGSTNDLHYRLRVRMDL